MEKSKAYKFHA